MSETEQLGLIEVCVGITEGIIHGWKNKVGRQKGGERMDGCEEGRQQSKQIR